MFLAACKSRSAVWLHLGHLKTLLPPSFWWSVPHSSHVFEVYASPTSTIVHHGKRAALDFSASLNAKCDQQHIWRTVLDLIFRLFFLTMRETWNFGIRTTRASWNKHTNEPQPTNQPTNQPPKKRIYILVKKKFKIIQS